MAPETQSTSLVRSLSLMDSVLVLAGGIIGSGIFLTAKDIAQSVLHPALFISIWVAGLLITMLACFALAELVAMFPSEVVAEKRQFLLPLPQRRDLYSDYIQPEIEVIAEFPA